MRGRQARENVKTRLQRWWQKRWTIYCLAEVKDQTLSNTVAKVEAEKLVHAGWKANKSKVQHSWLNTVKTIAQKSYAATG